MNFFTNLKRNLLVGVFFGFLIIVAFLLLGDLKELLALAKGFPVWVFLLVILCTLLNYLLRFAKWNIYLDCINIELPLKKSAVVFFSGLTMSITPGKAGEVLKSVLLERSEGHPVSRTAPIVVAERITDLLAMIFLASLGASLFANGLGVLIGTTVIIISFIAVFQSRSTSLKLVSVMGRLPVIAKFEKGLLNAYESTYTMLRLGILTKTLAISIVSWFFECLALYLIFLGFNTPQGLLESTFIFSFSSVAGAVSMIPGGLGVAEGSMTGLMVLLGIGKNTAVASTLLIRFGTLWFGVLLGVIILFLNLNHFSGRQDNGQSVT